MLLQLRFCAMVSVGCFCCLGATVALGDRRAPPAVDSVLDPVEKSIKNTGFLKAHPAFKLTREGNALILSYHPKEWLVYSSGMNGIWSKDPHKQVGPDSDAIIITVSVLDLKEATQEQSPFRASGFDLKGLDEELSTGRLSHVLRRPYWSLYGCGMDLPKRGVKVSCNIEFNNRTDQKLLRRAFAPITGTFERDNRHNAPK